MSDIWTLSTKPQRCINQHAHIFAASVINTVTDIIIVLLPIRIVRHLDLPRKQRRIVMALFAGGMLVSIVGAIRAYFTYRFAYDAKDDLTWHAHEMAMLGAMELLVGIVRPPIVTLPERENRSN
jgi:ABC-type enterochelin transport system permease subunit